MDENGFTPTAVGLRSAARAIILEDGGVKRAVRLTGTQLATQLAANYLAYKDEILSQNAPGGMLGYGPERRLLEICRSPDISKSTSICLIQQALELYA